MLLKSASRNPSPIGINIKRIISKTPTNLKLHSPTLKKKFTPTVNKSFTCYKEKVLSKHQRASSFDRSKENLNLRKSKNRSFRFTSKILHNPKEPSIDLIKSEIENGNYLKAIELINSSSKLEDSTDYLYSKGVCYMHLKQYKLAIDNFLQVLDKDPVFDKQLYVALYMSLLNSNQYVQALRYLSKGIRNFPGFLQAYLLRGQLLNRLKKFEKAAKDFKKVIVTDKSHQIAFINLAESYIGLRDWKKALKSLDQVHFGADLQKKSMLLKSKILYEMENFDESLFNLDQVLSLWPEESMASYYKAKINYEQKNYSEAALCFEQAIQNIKDPDIINSSVFYLGNIKIRERDFYGALHTFERSIKDCISSKHRALHLYTEGIICLMKRKLEEGVQIFLSLLKTKEPVLKEFLGSIYENLGFAYFSLSNFKKAVKAFGSAFKIQKIDKSSEFNLTVCEGVLAYLNKSQSKSLKCLKNAKKMFPKNPMPELIRSCILMHQSFKSEEYLHMLIKAELLVDNLAKTREPESEIMFCRSILKFCLKNYEVAYESAKKAIEKADENIPKHYIHRAFCNALLKKYEDAVQDFTIAIQLNSDWPWIYVYRGISAYLQDDLQQAFDDFTTLAKNSPNDFQILYQASNLLAMVGSYQDSLQIIDSLSPRPTEVDYLKAQNHLFLFELEKALEVLEQIPEGFKDYTQVTVDRTIVKTVLDIKNGQVSFEDLSHLHETLKDKEGKIFNKKYLFWFFGVVLFYCKQLNAASSYFQAVLEILHTEEPEVFADSITIEEENCEILYNLALCSFAAENVETSSQALLIFEELAEVLNTKHKGQLLLLSAITELRQNNKPKAEKLLKEAFKCDSETVGPFLKNQSTNVLPLHTQSELAEIFPLFLIQIRDLPDVYIRPSIVLPRISLDIKIEEVFNVVSGFYKVELVVPRAEAPWLIRNKGSIQFTEKLIEVASDLNETEKSVSQAPDEEKNGSKKKFASGSRSQFLRRFKSQGIARERSWVVGESDEAEEALDKDLESDIRWICDD